MQEFSRLGVWAMDSMASEKWAVFFDVLLLMSLRWGTERESVCLCVCE